MRPGIRVVPDTSTTTPSFPGTRTSELSNSRGKSAICKDLLENAQLRQAVHPSPRLSEFAALLRAAIITGGLPVRSRIVLFDPSETRIARQLVAAFPFLLFFALMEDANVNAAQER